MTRMRFGAAGPCAHATLELEPRTRRGARKGRGASRPAPMKVAPLLMNCLRVCAMAASSTAEDCGLRLPTVRVLDDERHARACGDERRESRAARNARRALADGPLRPLSVRREREGLG